LYFLERGRNQYIYFLITGVGKKKVRNSLRKILSEVRVSTLFSIGMAGALDSSLQIGDTVSVKKTCIRNKKGYSPDNYDEIQLDVLDVHLIKKVKANITVSSICRAEEKKTLSSFFDTVDMETYHIASVVREVSPTTKIYSLRAISDTKDCVIPPLEKVKGNFFQKILIMCINSLKNPRFFYWYPRFFLNSRKSVQKNTKVMFQLLTNTVS